MSVTDLVRELDRRKGTLSGLAADRDRLQGELDSVNAQIAELESLGVSAPAMMARRGPGRPPKTARGARVDGRRKGRGGNADSLPMALHRLLNGRTMGVAEMAEAVQKAGYKTKSPNFRTIVNAALLAKPNAGLFKKVSRGQYTAK
jgi:hypothetical protein